VQELPKYLNRLSTSSIEQAKKGPVIIPDTSKSAHWQVLKGTEYIACWMGIPLVVEGRPIGILNLDHHQVGFYNQEHLALAAGFGHQAAIAIDNARLFHELEQSNRDLIKAYDETIEGWSRALELRDQETEGHTQRVTEMTIELARAYGVPEEEIAHIRRGALLHDIGKMGIPDSILLKSGELTEEEREIMRMHPVLAYRMLSDISFLRKAMEIPYYHHEHWDGSGYPFGLKGEKIPLAARLFAIVDVWDALRSDRPYRKAWSRAEVIEYIRSLSGKQFDPHIVEIFLKMI
jgi:putative nucleotidyltransferase with HDIG domain